MVARTASIILGICAIILGIIFQGQNVAYMVGLTFSIAASANFPALVMSVFWKKFTTWGAVSSILFGTIATLLLIYLGPTIQVDLLFGKAGDVITPELAAKVAGIPGLETMTAGAKITAGHLAGLRLWLRSQWWFFPLKNPACTR